MKNKIKLPDKLSDLLELAVKDCKKVAKMKTRKLNMDDWHTPEDGKCEVCMAGAVMDRTLKLDPKKNANPLRFGADTATKLYAINELREGNYFCTTKELLSCEQSLEQLYDLCAPIRKYYGKFSGRAPWRVYLRVAKKLRAAGF